MRRGLSMAAACSLGVLVVACDWELDLGSSRSFDASVDVADVGTGDVSADVLDARPDASFSDADARDGQRDGGTMDADEAEVRPETLEAPCGEKGFCSAGQLCSRGCEVCMCSNEGEWYCFAGSCPQRCPEQRPADNSVCVGLGDVCKYTSGCGVEEIECQRHRWVSISKPCPPVCPGVQPGPKTECTSVGMKCFFETLCGTPNEAECLGGYWDVRETCSAICPSKPPMDGDLCKPEGASCPYSDAFCVKAECKDSRWVLLKTCP